MQRLPGIRIKNTGNHAVRIRGREYSLGTDPTAARARYAQLIAEHYGDPTRPPPPRRSGIRLIDAAEQMFTEYEVRRGHGTSGRWRNHLKRFLAIHGTADLVRLTTARPRENVYQPPIVPLLNAYVTDLSHPDATSDGLGYAPATIANDVNAVVRLINWSAENGFCPNVNFSAVRRPKIPQRDPETFAPRWIAAQALRARRHDRSWRARGRARAPSTLEAWMRLQYLACMRPSEVITMVHAIHGTDPSRWSGRFIEVRDASGRLVHKRGLFSLDQHKTAYKSKHRYVVLTDEALWWLDRCAPFVSTLAGYSTRVTTATRLPGPKSLERSAASRLRALGVDHTDVDLLLGHEPQGVWRSYVRVPWHMLREAAGRLTLERAHLDD